jgi:DNA (cytosine-5)-methyltransferase 1
MSLRDVTFGSLFSGIGGFDLGFERAGLVCSWQVEIDDKCRDVLTRHWPNVPKYEDVRNVGIGNLEPVDLVCGGFPCQDLSVAGQRAGLAGERSGLWFEFYRILAELKPGWVVIENVPGLLSSNGGADFAVILSGLVELGYGVCWRVLDAQFFGVPQRRRRVFIVGSLGDGRSAQVLFEREGSAWDSPPSREAGQGFARDVAPCLAASGRGTERTGESRGQDAVIPVLAATLRSASDSPAAHGKVNGTDRATLIAYGVSENQRAEVRLTEYSRQITSGGGKPGQGYSAQCVAFQQDATDKFSEGIAPTMRGKSNGGTRAYGVAGAWGVRRLTPTECERLQGFPDGHTAGQSDSARYRQLGNAVEVDCAEWIGKRLLEVLNGTG